MGREVRRVPKDWVHPSALNTHKDQYYLVPLYPGGWYEDTCKEYITEGVEPPSRSDYMPDWTDAEATHWQMYEDTSEGTPISPVMESPEELGKWLVENNASIFASSTADLETWMKIILDNGMSFLEWNLNGGGVRVL